MAGHLLPSALADAIFEGRWVTRPPHAWFAHAFGEQPDSSALLYALDEMQAMTRDWQDETLETWMGRGDETLERATSILIGELGYDRNIGVDLRSDPPVVRFITHDGRWKLAFQSVDALITSLRQAAG